MLPPTPLFCFCFFIFGFVLFCFFRFLVARHLEVQFGETPESLQISKKKGEKKKKIQKLLQPWLVHGSERGPSAPPNTLQGGCLWGSPNKKGFMGSPRGPGSSAGSRGWTRRTQSCLQPQPLGEFLRLLFMF